MANVVNVTSTSVGCKSQGNQPAQKKISTLRLASQGNLDVLRTADGTKSVLAHIKELTAEISQIGAPGDPVPSQWAGLIAIPPAGTQVKVSVGILVEYVVED